MSSKTCIYIYISIQQLAVGLVMFANSVTVSKGPHRSEYVPSCRFTRAHHPAETAHGSRGSTCEAAKRFPVAFRLRMDVQKGCYCIGCWSVSYFIRFSQEMSEIDIIDPIGATVFLGIHLFAVGMQHCCWSPGLPVFLNVLWSHGCVLIWK